VVVVVVVVIVVAAGAVAVVIVVIAAAVVVLLGSSMIKMSVFATTMIINLDGEGVSVVEGEWGGIKNASCLCGLWG